MLILIINNISKINYPSKFKSQNNPHGKFAVYIIRVPFSFIRTRAQILKSEVGRELKQGMRDVAWKNLIRTPLTISIERAYIRRAPKFNAKY